ncbi:hypothetical protein [Endozoicomonas atrinae]|uniref:hypothetical protein n=1 Tax=Endozoicomonas atrinae TaxID=1333660 RepID=UPI000826306E|nr:hypothetical protein [Endozoicomonas atrinae]
MIFGHEKLMIIHKRKPAPSFSFHSDTFENKTALFEIRLKENFSTLANDRGFGFASFVTPCIQEDIFLPEKVAKRLLSMDFVSTIVWAEVSFRVIDGKKNIELSSFGILLKM